MKTYVIGDIHGGLNGLKQILVRAPIVLGDTLIFLGDYVDGWPDSAQVVELLIELTESYTCIFLRGNHDKWCEDWLLLGQTQAGWIQQGGRATVESYIKTEYLTKDSHRQFFKNMINYHIDDENRGFVHGGFTSRKGLGHEPYESNYYWDRDLISICLMRHNMQLKEKEGMKHEVRSYKHKEVYVGHTTTIGWTIRKNGIIKNAQGIKSGCTVPINVCNVWDLDTGGGWNGKITIMDIDTKEYWQSDLLTDLYPGYRGRN
jgi:serine/threonine protein phosphatase 1